MDQPPKPPTKAQELGAFLLLSVVMAPVLAGAAVSGYGFLVWMLQLVSAPGDARTPPMLQRIRHTWDIIRQPSLHFSLGFLTAGGFIGGIVFWGGFTTIHCTNRSGVRAICPTATCRRPPRRCGARCSAP